MPRTIMPLACGTPGRVEGPTGDMRALRSIAAHGCPLVVPESPAKESSRRCPRPAAASSPWPEVSTQKHLLVHGVKTFHRRTTMKAQ